MTEPSAPSPSVSASDAFLAPDAALHSDAPAVMESATGLLDAALAPVADDLKSLSQTMLQLLPLESRSSQTIAAHIFAAGGKRIRPALFFLSSRVAEYKGPFQMSMAAVCEFVHTASLLHDDVVDSSTLRRNKPTANSIWGDESAVLVGDLIYSRASELMAETGKLEIVRSFAAAIRLMSEGELLQLDNIFDSSLTEERYLDVIHKKTAALIAAACQAPAILAERSSAEIAALSEFGRAVGMTFQIVDDCLDYMRSVDEIGKPVLADLAQGKITMPLILLLRSASPADAQFIRELCRQEQHSDQDLQRVHNLLETHRAIDLALERAASFSNKALSALKIFPDSPARQDLEAIVGYLSLRLN